MTDDQVWEFAETRTNNYGDFKLTELEKVASRQFVEIKVVGLPLTLVTVEFQTSLNLGTIIV